MTRPDAILDAAHRCADRSGLGATSMKDVAREAGVAQGLLHYYFDTRERLFDALAARLLDRHLARFREELARSGAERRRDVGLGWLRRRALGDRGAWRLLFEVIVNGSRRRGGALAARFAERRALIAEQIGGERAAAKAMVLDAMMLGLAAERLAGASDREIEAALDTLEELLA